VAERVGERRIVGETNRRAGIVREEQVAPIVRAVHDRNDASAAHLRRRVHVSHEANRRDVPLGRGCRHGGGHIAEAIDAGVEESEALELADEIAKQHELAGRARIRRRAIVGLGVVPDVAQKALEHPGRDAIVADP
jgi:hypothetical protein